MHEVEAGLDAGLALRERRLAHRLLLMSTAGQSCGFVQIGQVKIPAAGVKHGAGSCIAMQCRFERHEERQHMEPVTNELRLLLEREKIRDCIADRKSKRLNSSP